MQRVHWDPAFARKSGNPTTFDYGRMRETWLIHLCTDWMGDDAWLWRLDCEFRKFNYVGDTQWLRGRVIRKFLAEGSRPAVELQLEAVNQRDEVTTPGHATILLPSRGAGRGAAARSARRRPLAAGRAGGDLGRVHRRRWRAMSVDIRVDDRGVLSLRLDRPEKRNAITDDMMRDLISRDRAGRDRRQRRASILLEGAGDHFCAGFDFVARNVAGGDAAACRAASSAGSRRRRTV